MSDKMQIVIDVDSGKASTKIKSLKKELGRMSSETDKASESTSSLSTALGGLAIGATAIAAASKLISVARSFDVINASLVTVTGSAENADKAFEQIQSFASTTPFALEQVANAFIKMKALGLDPSEAALTSYGNTASAMGRDLNQMIEAVADAATGEFERLKEFGIKASSQGDKVSFTFRGVTKTVGKNSKEIEGYLKNIGDTDFSGAMALRAATLDGTLSNLSDSWDSLFLTISESGIGESINDVAKSMVNLTEKTSSFIGSFKDGGTRDLEAAAENIGKINTQVARLESYLESKKDSVLPDWINASGISTAEERLKALRAELKQNIDLLTHAPEAAPTLDLPTPPSGDQSGDDNVSTRQQELEARQLAIAISSSQARFDALSLIAQTAGDDEETRAIDAFQQKIDRMDVEKEFLIEKGAERVELERQADENRLLLAVDLEGRIAGIRKNARDKEVNELIKQKQFVADIERGAWDFMGNLARLGGDKYVKAYKKVVLAQALITAASGAVDAWKSGLVAGAPFGMSIPMAVASEAAHWSHVAGLMADLGGGGGATATAPTPASASQPTTVTSSATQADSNSPVAQPMNISLKIDGLTGNEPPHVLQQITDMLAPAISEQIAAGGNNVAVV